MLIAPQVYALESVLKLKKDTATQVTFLDEAMQVNILSRAWNECEFLIPPNKTLENKPSSMFWTSLAVALEKHSKEAASSELERGKVIWRLLMMTGLGSTFLQQTLSNGYPRFLRLFHDFFAKIAVRTDTVYNEAQQRYLSHSFRYLIWLK